MSGTLSVRSDFDINVLAPIVMGTILNWTLFGVLITQFSYGVIFLETVQSGLALADLFYLIGIMNEVEDSYLTGSALSPWAGPILIGGVVAMIVQLFFAYRIWVLSNKKSWWVCLTILFVLMNGDPTSLVIGWLAASVTTDGIITISMLYLLKGGRSEGTSLSTQNSISKIVRLTVETNLLTSEFATPVHCPVSRSSSATMAIIALVLFAVTFANDSTLTLNWSYCSLAIIGKLYANSLFASLNNRIAIRHGPTPGAAIMIPDTTLPMGRPSNDTSDGMYLQLDRSPSVMIFTPSSDNTRRPRECEGGDDSESLVIDIA
ncbi:hypothetical protein V8E53_008338 [Lactarius tabidus]